MRQSNLTHLVIQEVCQHWGMSTDPMTVDELIDQKFTIHALNNYSGGWLSSLMDEFGIDEAGARRMIRIQHYRLVKNLAERGVRYSELRAALVPDSDRREVAFVFDSSKTGSNFYGSDLAKVWIPALKKSGPKKCTIRVGDFLRMTDDFVWHHLEKELVGPKGFPRVPCSTYYSLYLTNLSPTQLASIHAELTAGSGAYLGHVDCSTWTPLKGGMFLPQIGLRFENRIIMPFVEEEEDVNAARYPYEENGFELIGVQEENYSLFLEQRLDNGVPEWADQESALALAALGGKRRPARDGGVEISDSRLKFLQEKHGASLKASGLDNLSQKEFAEAVRQALGGGVIYGLRSTEGKRGDVLDPALDAVLYSVQVQIPQADGSIRRFQVGLKYDPVKHQSEIVTFF